MSKWRPADLNCLYVIPDIRGGANFLKRILTRILPLRKSDGGKDRLIFLGNYVGKGDYSAQVVEQIIELKRRFKDKVVCLRGVNDQLFLEACGAISGITSEKVKIQYDRFMYEHGGPQTIKSYMDRVGFERANPWDFDRHKLLSIIPKEHIEFLKNELVNYYEFEQYIFVHGGCDPVVPLSEQSMRMLLFDETLHNLVIQGRPKEWEKTIVTGHFGEKKNSEPYIHEKYMMLDCGAPKQLAIFELSTLSAQIAYPENPDNLVPLPLKLSDEI